MARAISEYNRKRNFDITSEPRETKKTKSPTGALSFVIQKHDATRLHYDFRLELGGTLISWAVPKGPSLDPRDKRLAVHVEDHPLGYAKFEGNIPHGQYGGGDVIVWDKGVWVPQGDAKAGYKAGKLKFALNGEKLAGNWTLVKTHLRGSGDKEQWLLIKENDEFARAAEDYDIVQDRPESVITGDLLPVDKKENTVSVSKAGSSITKKKTTPSTKSSALKNGDKKSTAKKSSKTITQSARISLPLTLAPQLATLVNEPPKGEWLYEIKFDGYRMLTRVLDGKVSLFTRNGHDWTEKLKPHAKAIEALHLEDSWLDGEIIVLNEKGLPSFQLLQNAMDVKHVQDIIYYLFDAPFLNGKDLRRVALEERRAALKKAIGNQAKGLLGFSEIFTADHKSIIESACSMSLEGVIGKRAGSFYISHRSADWIKLKCRLRQEFVIVGYTDPQGSRNSFGAILLAVHKGNKNSELMYAGRVGTGFNQERLHDIYKKMHALEQKESPLSEKLTGMQARGVHWIKPQLVCEVEFAEWTESGVVRQASFISLRTDKPAKEIIREQAKPLGESAGFKEQNAKQSRDQSVLEKTDTAKANTKKVAKKTSDQIVTSTGKNKEPIIASIGISHPDRVIDKESGNTKLDLAIFYESIAEFILPHLKDRPVSLLRAPEGIAGEQFFQKHADNKSIPHITLLDPSLDPGHGRLMQIDNSGALVSCVQMNTIEFHTWGSTSNNIEMPDRFVLDLDPDPALPWRSVIEATQLTLAVLDELKLTAYLKTTGGKGMHILVPLTPDASWEHVKAFSKAISQFMAEKIPERFVAKMGPKNRIGKIFIDYLRNSRGASTVCAYSVRARPELSVSVPIARDELDKISQPNYWNINNLPQRLEKLKKDPWDGYTGNRYKKKQKITKTMWEKLGVAAPDDF